MIPVWTRTKNKKLVINSRGGENESDGPVAIWGESLAFDRPSTYLSVSGQACQKPVFPFDLLQDD